jgi:hypothetical protein
VFTSPPYAAQREYDPESGFTPVPPEAYCDWFRVVAANIAAVLAPDGSYFLNIKPHAEEGERNRQGLPPERPKGREAHFRGTCHGRVPTGVP